MTLNKINIKLILQCQGQVSRSEHFLKITNYKLATRFNNFKLGQKLGQMIQMKYKKVYKNKVFLLSQVNTCKHTNNICQYDVYYLILIYNKLSN